MTALVRASHLALPGRLQSTSLELKAGELTCLVGPNGSGKTSLLHAIAGIGRPFGTVRIGDADPITLAPAERRRALAYLPAMREVKWPLTARAVIALGAAAPGDEAAIGPLLSALELAPLAERRVDLMSTGERSRVLIARALVSKPRLLLLDEPVANLDPLWQLRLMDWLRRMAEAEGQAMLVAIHDLDLARDYADRLLIMEGGKVVADGAPAALLEGPEIRQVFGIERVEGRWRPIP